MTTVDEKYLSLAGGEVYVKATDVEELESWGEGAVIANPSPGKKLYINSILVCMQNPGKKVTIDVFDNESDITPQSPELFKDLYTATVVRPIFLDFSGCPIQLEDDQVLKAIEDDNTNAKIVVTGFEI